MANDYQIAVEKATEILAPLAHKFVSAQECAAEIDGDVLELVRDVGKRVIETVLSGSAAQAVAKAVAHGGRVEVRRTILVETVLGTIPVESPVLRKRQGRKSVRPVAVALGIRHAMKTVRLRRAITDFGGNESFARAAERMREHYGFEVGRTSILRVVKEQARIADDFVRRRLGSAQDLYEMPEAERKSHPSMLAELDGCEIRTGTYEPGEGVTPKRGSPKRRRNEAWRDVRMGLVKRDEEATASYVGYMGEYPEICDRLFRLAVSLGLGPQTQVLSVGDGGIGLMEAIKAHLPNVQYIVDYYHMKSHIIETAEEMGKEGKKKDSWILAAMKSLASGRQAQFRKRLRTHKGQGAHRVQNLQKHIKRFADCVHYDRYRELGYPIGSGDVESCHRSIPQRRLKLPGTWWHPDSINPMLSLLIIRPNGWWEDFWAAQHRETALAAVG